jgi:hypothetical protein
VAEPLDPALRATLHSRFADLLDRVATATLDSIRTLFAAGAPTAEEIAPILMAAESATIDLTAANLGILTGETIAADTTATTIAAELAAELAATNVETATAKASTFIYQASANESRRINTTLARPVRYWVRVTTPGETCGLCVLAATRVYKRADLEPIHDHCRCTVRALLPDESITDFKTRVLPLAGQVDTQLADATARNGRPSTANKSRSRAKNVRVITPEPQS